MMYKAGATCSGHIQGIMTITAHSHSCLVHVGLPYLCLIYLGPETFNFS